MGFALFVGEGNIIFSPMFDQQASCVWNSPAGFLLTTVSLDTCANTVSIRG
ncbi:branched-chain amino acid transport system II carrier protein [Photorhabdus caribbeanensis]|uniref:branched-chain amino acid transport system II carrier protein n=1 Tax=Photorhabdus caribbeanensis TaxID=1004165 RepID=UPI001BD33FCF|nr:hypothetical protein [Photorhabdus caribbeanensis]